MTSSLEDQDYLQIHYYDHRTSFHEFFKTPPSDVQWKVLKKEKLKAGTTGGRWKDLSMRRMLQWPNDNNFAWIATRNVWWHFKGQLPHLSAHSLTPPISLHQAGPCEKSTNSVQPAHSLHNSVLWRRIAKATKMGRAWGDFKELVTREQAGKEAGGSWQECCKEAKRQILRQGMLDWGSQPSLAPQTLACKSVNVNAYEHFPHNIQAAGVTWMLNWNCTHT